MFHYFYCNYRLLFENSYNDCCVDKTKDGNIFYFLFNKISIFESHLTINNIPVANQLIYYCLVNEFPFECNKCFLQSKIE